MTPQNISDINGIAKLDYFNSLLDPAAEICAKEIMYVADILRKLYTCSTFPRLPVHSICLQCFDAVG